MTFSDISDTIHAQQSTNKTETMTIDEAIERLKEAKEEDVKNIILAFWDAEMFQSEDDVEWGEKVDDLEMNFDWSNTHSELQTYLETL